MSQSEQPHDPVDGEALLRTPAADAFRLSNKEQQVLQLWAELQELELEKALLVAEQNTPEVDSPSAEADQLRSSLQTLQEEVLDARAEYSLRQKVTNTVLTTDSILKAAHASSHANALEACLLPLLPERDVLSLYLTTVTTETSRLSTMLYDLEAQVSIQNDLNARIASEMLQLAKDAKVEITAEEIQDPNLKRELETAHLKLKEAQRTHQNIKGLLCTIIIGSGIDWVRADEGRWAGYILNDADDDGG